MALLLFSLLIVLPIVEIFLLIQGAVAFGVIPVLLLTIGTAALGTFLIKRQGLRALGELRGDLASGRPPVGSVVDGAALLVAAPLLMTPGFVTDVFGFLLLIPYVRHEAARALLRRIKKAHDEGRIVITTRG